MQCSINNADNVKGITDYDKRILTAEAKTLRAFYNLLLVTYYGPVTLSQEDISKGETNVRPVRNTVEEFYTAIIKDLTEASDELDVQPYGGNYARVCKRLLSDYSHVPMHKVQAKVSLKME